MSLEEDFGILPGGGEDLGRLGDQDIRRGRLLSPKDLRFDCQLFTPSQLSSRRLLPPS